MPGGSAQRPPPCDRPAAWLALLLWLAGETVNKSTKPSVWDLHSNALGVRVPDVFVKLRLESDRQAVLENPVGQIEEIAGVPNG